MHRYTLSIKSCWIPSGAPAIFVIRILPVPVFNIGCFGQIDLTASDSRRVVEKLVGTERSLKKNEVEMKFRQLLMAEVRDKLVNTMLDNGVSIIHLSAKLNSIAKLLNPAVAELFGNYGFSLENFCISGANIPEDDPEYQRLKRLRANQGMMFSELAAETAGRTDEISD